LYQTVILQERYMNIYILLIFLVPNIILQNKKVYMYIYGLISYVIIYIYIYYVYIFLYFYREESVVQENLCQYRFPLTFPREFVYIF